MSLSKPAGVNPHAYNGSYAVICTEATAVKNTLRDMSLCVMCNKHADPDDMMTVCQLPANEMRRNTDTKIPPCMICRSCAMQGKHEGACDDHGNKMCKACPLTLLALQNAYEKQGKPMPRGTGVRNGWCMPRWQPSGNSVQLGLLRKQFSEFTETVTTVYQREDRKNRILAAKLERMEHQAADPDAPARTYQEREERHQELLQEADRDANAEEVAEAAARGDDAPEDAPEDGEALEEQLYAESEAGEEALYEQLVAEQAADTAAASANEDGSMVGDDERGRAEMQAETCDAAMDSDEGDEGDEDGEVAPNAQKKRRTTLGAHVSTAERALPPSAAEQGGAAASKRKRGGSRAQPAAEAADALTEADAAAENFQCPKGYVKQFRKWKQEGKETADFIEWMNMDKSQRSARAKINRDNVKNYANVVKERDAAIERAENEAKEKKSAVKKVKDECKKKIAEQHSAIEEMMEFLAHIGVQSADIGAMANGTLKAAEAKGMYTTIALAATETAEVLDAVEDADEPVDSA